MDSCGRAEASGRFQRPCDGLCSWARRQPPVSAVTPDFDWPVHISPARRRPYLIQRALGHQMNPVNVDLGPVPRAPPVCGGAPRRRSGTNGGNLRVWGRSPLRCLLFNNSAATRRSVQMRLHHFYKRQKRKKGPPVPDQCARVLCTSSSTNRIFDKIRATLNPRFVGKGKPGLSVPHPGPVLFWFL